MKKLLLLISILLLTGCTCEYNLNIDNLTYQEEIIIKGENEEEINNLNQEWEIPIDKEEYNIGGDEDTILSSNIDTYKYQFINNTLKFNYDFTKNSIINSSAISSCYNKITVVNYDNKTIISTSPKINCFSKYPNLTKLTVNIKTDKLVINHDADSVNGNVYTWNFTKSTSSDKAINLTFEPLPNEQKPTSSSSSIVPNNSSKNDYTLYIFSAILLVVMLSGYFIFNKIKNKNDMDND